MADGTQKMASLTDSEGLAVGRQMVTVYSSTECPLTPLPEPFIQPAEAVAAYDTYKKIADAAHPSDSTQVVKQRAAQRKLFDAVMGSLVDLIELGARKDSSLPAKFGIDALAKHKAKSVNKMGVLLAIPLLVLKTFDKERGSAHCKVQGGARKAIEIYFTYDDPSNEANWQHFDSFVNATFWMRGLTSGHRAYVRARFIFAQGKKGPWSEITSIMVP
jgi:hypothetical protein